MEADPLKTEILALLEQLRPDVDFGAEHNLIADGLLTSFDVVMLVSELRRSLRVKIPAWAIRPEAFASLEAIAALAARWRTP